MKNFNKSFQVKITANMIAEKLLNVIDSNMEQSKRELITESIIGPMCSENNKVGDTQMRHLYFGLMESDITAPKFKDTDGISCSKKIWTYTDQEEEKSVEIGNNCRLIGFDPYRDDQYEIEYSITNSKGEQNNRTCWVSEEQLSLTNDSVNEIISE